MYDTIQDQVLRGAAFLDQTKPEWYTLVDIDTLEMGSSANCVAGQVFADEVSGDLWDGYDYLYHKHGGQWLIDHAFVFSGREEWIEQIQARLTADELVSA